MGLVQGSKLGPYEILSPLGAGGMGEVYRARDERLKRDLAIKVLPEELASDKDRRARFEREARSASALSHPNILTIHDIGSVGPTVYIAMELVDGVTLREALASGPLPTKKTLDIAVQMTEALAAAHAAGIVHRDLKPENVMVSKLGYVKILDFGLAKLVSPDSEEHSNLQTAVEGTIPGMVLGTVGYMSPEQAAGRAVDFRSDQFSFGSILYELATGKRAFHRDTSAETLTAIIREEPEPVAALNPRTPAPLRWIVERCLAKDPEERFGATRDLARDLASIRDHLSEASVTGTGEVPGLPTPPARRRRLLPALAGLALLGVVGVAAFAAGRRTARTAAPSFRQLTFQRGEIYSGRFGPDGQTILYAAAWEGRPVEIFASRVDSPESRPFGLAGADVLAVSASGEMAVSLDRRLVGAFTRSGTLARIGMTGGGTPREVLEDVQWADWAPGGTNLAIVRDTGTLNLLELPVGKVLYKTDGWVSHPRVSPRGDLVAFLDHPTRGDDGGSVATVDRSGEKKTLSKLFSTAGGLAWSPDGREVWFTAAEVGGNRALHAVTPSGSERLLSRVTGNLTLQDVSRDGRVLISHDTLRSGILGLAPGEQKERDLSWLDWSSAIDISPDGASMVFFESGEGGGPGYSSYLRKMEGSPPVRLGEGAVQSMSPDGKWVIAIVRSTTDRQAVLLPTGAGEPRPLSTPGLGVSAASWFPDGKRILLTASEQGRGNRLYVMDSDASKPRALTPVGYRYFLRTISPDGKRVAVVGPDRRHYLYPLDGGEPTAIPGLAPDDRPAGWTSDGQSLYVSRSGELPARIWRVDPATGKRELWKDLSPLDSAGVYSIAPPRIAPDGKAYVYSYNRILSDLFLAEGIR
jgi:Tol biopolymer transport system component/tRNA A-37 threonylcarbamoyl transferase component Bud32